MGHAPLLYDELDAMENLRYFAGLYGIHDDALCADAIRRVGLDPELKRRVGQYSQGMRQRISLARAILHDPDLLLLDEPFSNVDVTSARRHGRTCSATHARRRQDDLRRHASGGRDGTGRRRIRADGRRTHRRPRARDSAASGESLRAFARCNNERTLVTAPHTYRRANPACSAVTRASLAKDLRMEWRSKDAINSMLFFSLLVVVIFSFAFDPTAEESRRIAGGLIWVAFLFATVVALNQTWARELRNQVLDAYRISPAPAAALFISKAIGNFLFVCVLEALMTPLFIVFYNLRSVGPAYQLVIVVSAGNVGTGRERHVFRRAFDSHAQPRDHVAADTVPYLHPGAGRHGGCDDA